MKGNPFLGAKFLWQGLPYIEKLLSEDYWKLPPVTVEIDPSNLCNHNCIWCFCDEFRFREPKNISPVDMGRVIREVADIGCKAITFVGGGEPLYNSEIFPKSFYDVVNNGMKLGLVTNGALLGKYIKGVSDTCTFVRISLDSASPKVHEMTHRTKDFQKILGNIKQIVELTDVDVGLAFLVHPVNFHEVEDFCRLGYDLGVDYVQIRPVWMQGLSLSNKIIDSVFQSVENMSHLNSNEFQIFLRMDRFEEIRTKEKGFSECLSTPLVGVVGADLNVYLCCQTRGFSNYSFGNLNSSSFKNIWYGERRREIMKGIDVDRCPPCRYRPYNIVLHDLKYCNHIDFL